MCRLIAFASAEPTSLRDLIGIDQLTRFTSLAAVHGDGWGTSWLPEAEASRPDEGPLPIRHLRSPRPAAEDPAFHDHASAVASRARILHLRWATGGFAVETENTHPFHADGVSFAHNGSITPPDRIEKLLDEEALSELHGQTDSERYFALIRQELRAGDELTAAVLRAVTALRAEYPASSFNALLLSEEELVVVHANSSLSTPYDDLQALPAGPPADHLDAYFLMRWCRTADGSLVFASTGLSPEGWQPLPEQSVTTVDLRNRELHTELLAPRAEKPPAPHWSRPVSVPGSAGEPDQLRGSPSAWRR